MMADHARHWSVARARPRRSFAGVAPGIGLAFAAVVSGGLLASGLAPTIPLIMATVALLGGGIWRYPLCGLYGILFAVLFLEESGIPGLESLTDETIFYLTLATYTPLPLPLRTMEIPLYFTLVVVIARSWLGGHLPFRRGALFTPAMLLLATALAALAWGALRGGTPAFNIKAGWVETRGFVYLVVAYLLVCNLITNRRRLTGLIWVLIAAVGLKGLQGISRFASEVRAGLRLEAITGHEDVVFFATFFLLLAANAVFGGDPQQRRVQILLLPAVVFTLLATGRRIGFIVLAVGFLVFGLVLFKARRALFLRLVPLVAVLILAYTGLFWNATGPVAEPLRAFRSQFGDASVRDQSSNEWRQLENVNIRHNIREAPLTGLGFGRQYAFAVEQPSLDDTGFIYWRYITHNAIYWVWMKMGLPGFVAFWLLLGSAIVRGLIGARLLANQQLRAVAAVSACLVVVQVFYSYGDLGLTNARTMIHLGCILGVLAKLPDLDREPVPCLERAGEDNGYGTLARVA